MSSEVEVPIEKVQEDIHHQVLHGSNDTHSTTARYIMIGALMSAVLAVFAAISALMAGQASDEAMIRQIESSDQWALYQAKGIKSSITEIKLQLEEARPIEPAPPLGHLAVVPPDANSAINKKTEFHQTIERYHQEQEQIKETAMEKEIESKRSLKVHEKFAMAVTFFQVAIALTAISVLTKKWQILYLTGVFGVCGLYFMTFAILAMNSK